MRINFRLGWFRIELKPRFRIVLDVRKRVGGNKSYHDIKRK